MRSREAKSARFSNSKTILSKIRKVRDMRIENCMLKIKIDQMKMQTKKIKIKKFAQE